MHPVILDHPVGGGYGVAAQRGKRREGVGRGVAESEGRRYRG